MCIGADIWASILGLRNDSRTCALTAFLKGVFSTNIKDRFRRCCVPAFDDQGLSEEGLARTCSALLVLLSLPPGRPCSTLRDFSPWEAPRVGLLGRLREEVGWDPWLPVVGNGRRKDLETRTPFESNRIVLVSPSCPLFTPLPG